jgi:prepilin-type N-terminal cleavage/methylation domain-containing protein
MDLTFGSGTSMYGKELVQMVRNNQAGVTLIELLAAIVIMSVIAVPIFTLMTDSSTRTAIQGKESQLQYFAQEIMEEAQNNRTLRGDILTSGGVREGECSSNGGCNLSGGNSLSDPEATYQLEIKLVNHDLGEASGNMVFFHEIKVTVESTNVVSPSIELVTVVRP